MTALCAEGGSVSQTIIADARLIRDELRKWEDQSDSALASNATVLASLLSARVANKLPAAVGRQPINLVLDAMAIGATAREKILETHALLGAMNLRELATGDFLDCPQEQFGQLRLVETSHKSA
jgi:hypothetical protein